MRKVLALLLIFSMTLSMFPSIAFGSEFVDMPNNWSTAALENAVKNQLLKGSDGKLMSDEALTRAEMAAVVNRAFGSSQKASIHFTDVAGSSWYYDDIAKAVHMKTFVGSGDKFKPDSKITREEAFTVLARAFKLSGAKRDTLNKFSDGGQISPWALDGVSPLVSAGYVSGSGGFLNPKQSITRAEFAQIMDNLIKHYINEAGAYEKDYKGSVMVNAPNVILKNLTISGDLIIGDGVGDGDVTLDGVTVTGKTIIRGGGENSIRVIGDSNIKDVIIARVDGVVRVYAEDGTEVGKIIVDGSDDVIIQGNFGSITVLSSNISVTARGNFESAVVEGENSKIVVSEGSEINKIAAKGQGTIVEGNGTVKEVDADANNINVKTQGTNVTAGTGATGVMAGETPVKPGTTERVKAKPPASSGGGGGGSPIIIYPERIEITSAENITSFAIGQTLQLNAAVTPSNATNKNIVWSVEPEEIATIDDNGLLTGRAVGDAIVKATAKGKSNSSITAEFNISVSSITIDYLNEKTIETIPSTVEYSVDGGATWVSGSDTKLDLIPGQNIDFRFIDDESLMQTLIVPARPAAVTFSADGVDDVLTGLPAEAAGLEVRILSGEEVLLDWTDIEVDADGVTVLDHNGGNLIQVRQKAVAGTSFAGEISQEYSIQTIGELEIGALVVDKTWSWEEKGSIPWIVVAKDHYTDSSVTLLAKNLINQFMFDDRNRGSDNNGYNDWGGSTRLRPWLNGTGTYLRNGFYDTFSEEFKNAVLEVTVPNTKRRNEGNYTTLDKVFIPSAYEVGSLEATEEFYDEISKETWIMDCTYLIGEVYPFFADATDSDRLAKLGSSYSSYWTRSPDSFWEDIVHVIQSDGQHLLDGLAYNPIARLNNGVRPVLNLSDDVLVTGAPNEDGVYEIVYK